MGGLKGLRTTFRIFTDGSRDISDDDWENSDPDQVSDKEWHGFTVFYNKNERILRSSAKGESAAEGPFGEPLE